MKLKEKVMLELDAGASLDSSWSELDHQVQSPLQGVNYMETTGTSKPLGQQKGSSPRRRAQPRSYREHTVKFFIQGTPVS